MLFRSNDTATTEIYTLSLHDALPILAWNIGGWPACVALVAVMLAIMALIVLLVWTPGVPGTPASAPIELA